MCDIVLDSEIGTMLKPDFLVNFRDVSNFDQRKINLGNDKINNNKPTV